MYSANVNKNNRKLPVEMLIMLNFIRRQVIKTEITENQYVICMKQTTFMASDCETGGKNKIFSVKIKNPS